MWFEVNFWQDVEKVFRKVSIDCASVGSIVGKIGENFRWNCFAVISSKLLNSQHEFSV